MQELWGASRRLEQMRCNTPVEQASMTHWIIIDDIEVKPATLDADDRCKSAGVSALMTEFTHYPPTEEQAAIYRDWMTLNAQDWFAGRLAGRRVGWITPRSGQRVVGPAKMVRIDERQP